MANLTRSYVASKNLFKNLQIPICSTVTSRTNTWWAGVKLGPPDAILGITEAYNNSKNPNKINLGVGAYKDDDGKPYILPSVATACANIEKKKMNHEYLPISGHADYCKQAAKLAFGDNNPCIIENQTVTVQSISGTGALTIGSLFLSKFWPGAKEVYLPTPTWPNHIPVFANNGISIKRYRYFDPKTVGLDIKGLLEDISKIPEKSIILLHACAHNPTGVDPTPEQWKEICAKIKERNIYPFFDMAYQGFATGNIDNDASAVRLFIDEGIHLCLAQSFAKNMGLYGQRVGAFTITTGGKEESERVMSQLKILIRPLYSNPPAHGARIVNEILSDKALRDVWLEDVKRMANRIIDMRKCLKEGLVSLGSKKNWNHITNQIGMFCFTGMTPEQVDKITKDHHVFLTKDGRISISGINTKNVCYLANAMHEVTK